MKIRDFVPPIIPKLLSTIRPRHAGWFGNYSSWNEALSKSTGYDSVEIVERVKSALVKVKNGEAAYERDSVLFHQIEYTWPLVGALMWVAAQAAGRLNVLDFGGSLGSTYFQYRKFFSGLKEVRWNVVEQKIFVDCGKKHFEDGVLRFYSTLEECFSHHKPSVVLFSSVLQYLEFPFNLLKSTFDQAPDFIIVNDTAFLEKDNRITLQKVPPEIYPASYPCWLLNKAEFLRFFNAQYELVSEFKSGIFIRLGSRLLPYEGFIFRRSKLTEHD